MPRIVSPQSLPEDDVLEASGRTAFSSKGGSVGNMHRPQTFQDFVGQTALCHNLNVFIQAALCRQEALDHTLLSGPPGLGKTTLAHLMAQAMSSQVRMTSGPVLHKAGDVAALLTALQPYDVLFIDEIHRLPIAVEEILYSAMEDYKIDIMVGEGSQAHALQIPLTPFTLVGATTRSGLLSAPLRDRFGISLCLEFYTPQDMACILEKAAQRASLDITPPALELLAGRCRGTPRIGLRLLRRVRDFAQEQGACITPQVALEALGHLGISPQGLDPLDQKYLGVLAEVFHGGPVGIDTLAAVVAETRDTLEDVVEPYLLQQGLVQRTARGRMLTASGKALWRVK